MRKYKKAPIRSRSRSISYDNYCKSQMDIPYGPRRTQWRDTLSEMAISPADGKLLVTPPSIDPLALQNHVRTYVCMYVCMYQAVSQLLLTRSHPPDSPRRSTTGPWRKHIGYFTRDVSQCWASWCPKIFNIRTYCTRH